MSASLTSFLYLGLAIVMETMATSLLVLSEQFTRPLPTAGMAVGYLASFYLLSLALRTIPIGVAYAIWSGLGIVLISGIGFFVLKQHLDAAAYVGIGLIIAGVLVIRLFSSSMPH